MSVNHHINDESSVQSSHKVQLTLDDLSYPSGENDMMSATTEASVHPDQGRNPQDYRRELNKLLKKSRGTPYEKTLRKFVESKLREMAQDSQLQRSRPFSPAKGNATPKAPPQQPTTPVGSPKLIYPNLASLSTSVYDSPRRGGSNGPGLSSPVVRMAQEENSRQRIEEMAQPLERHRYHGFTDYRVTTNHLGRQRPPPKMENNPHSLQQFSPYKTTITSSTARHMSQPNSPLRQSQERLEAPSNKVSMQEFRQWLRHNRRWDAKTKYKTESSRERLALAIDNDRKPRIIPKSIKLAELAQQRDTQEFLDLQAYFKQQRMRQQQEEEETQREEAQQEEKQREGRSLSRHNGHSSLPARSGSRGHSSAGVRSASPAKYLDVAPHEEAAVVQALSHGDIFTRLSLRGKVHAEKARILAEHERNLLFDRANFVPHLAPRTDRYAEKYHQRVVQPVTHTDTNNRSSNGSGRGRSRSRDEQPPNISSNQSYQSQQSSRASSASPSRASSVRLVTGGQRMSPGDAFTKGEDTRDRDDNNSVDFHTPNKASRQHQQHHSQVKKARASATPPRSQREMAEEGIAMARSRSVERHRKQAEETLRRQYYVLPKATYATSGTTALQTSTDTHVTTPMRSRSVDASRSHQKPLQTSQETENLSTAWSARYASPQPARPFTPTLVAAQTTNALVTSSFAERNLLAIERQYIRAMLSSGEPAPGPGQYAGSSHSMHPNNNSSMSTSQKLPGGNQVRHHLSPAKRHQLLQQHRLHQRALQQQVQSAPSSGTSESNTASASATAVVAAVPTSSNTGSIIAPADASSSSNYLNMIDERRVQSPGAQGYSFGKERARSSILPHATTSDDLSMYTYKRHKQQQWQALATASNGTQPGASSTAETNEEEDDGGSKGENDSVGPNSGLRMWSPQLSPSTSLVITRARLRSSPLSKTVSANDSTGGNHSHRGNNNRRQLSRSMSPVVSVGMRRGSNQVTGSSSSVTIPMSTSRSGAPVSSAPTSPVNHHPNPPLSQQAATILNTKANASSHSRSSSYLGSGQSVRSTTSSMGSQSLQQQQHYGQQRMHRRDIDV